MTNQHQPKTYNQALKESFAEHVANTGGRSEYMKPDFDEGFSAGYKAALHDSERELRERAAIAAMQGLLSNEIWMSNVTKTMEKKAGSNEETMIELTAKAVIDTSVGLATALVNQLNTPQS